MTKIGKRRGFLAEGAGSNEEAVLQDPGTKKSVMVYLLGKNGIGKEPLGVIVERRLSERDSSNAIGMLRLAREEFAETEEEARRIVIGDYV